LLDTGFSNTFPIFLTSFLVFSSSEQKLSVTMKSAHLFFFSFAVCAFGVTSKKKHYLPKDHRDLLIHLLLSVLSF
jgi:hypothetical protein